jgi:hypothetical protein
MGAEKIGNRVNSVQQSQGNKGDPPHSPSVRHSLSCSLLGCWLSELIVNENVAILLRTYLSLEKDCQKERTSSLALRKVASHFVPHIIHLLRSCSKSSHVCPSLISRKESGGSGGMKAAAGALEPTGFSPHHPCVREEHNALPLPTAPSPHCSDRERDRDV